MSHPLAEGGVAKSLGCIWTLAVNTVRESVRNKILYVLLFFAVVMISAGVLVGSLSYVESERILQDIGLGAIRMFGVAIAIFGSTVSSRLLTENLNTPRSGATSATIGSLVNVFLSPNGL